MCQRGGESGDDADTIATDFVAGAVVLYDTFEGVGVFDAAISITDEALCTICILDTLVPLAADRAILYIADESCWTIDITSTGTTLSRLGAEAIDTREACCARRRGLATALQRCLVDTELKATCKVLGAVGVCRASLATWRDTFALVAEQSGLAFICPVTICANLQPETTSGLQVEGKKRQEKKQIPMSCAHESSSFG